jgi:hypothetical protein
MNTAHAARASAAHAAAHKRAVISVAGPQPRVPLPTLRVHCTRQRKSRLPAKAKSMSIMTKIYEKSCSPLLPPRPHSCYCICKRSGRLMHFTVQRSS